MKVELLEGLSRGERAALVELAQTNPAIDALWLYGSVAKGTHTASSDIDLAVLYCDYERDPVERRLRPELLALEWMHQLSIPEGKLSVLDIQNVAIPLAMEVLSTGQLLVNKAPGHELKVSQAIMSRWEIDYLHHYKHYE